MSAMRRDSVKTAGQRTARHTFSVAEANRAVVLVKRIVADVIEEYARLLDLQETLEAAEASGAAEQYEQTRLALIRSAGRLRSCLVELDDIGVELKDWSLGVVDFPSVAGGRAICLTWQHGRECVEHWHEMDSSFARLEPLATLPAAGQYVGQQGSDASRRPPFRGSKKRLPKR